MQLTGTLVSTSANSCVIDCGGVGYELGISTTTAAQLPERSSSGVCLLTRMIVREDAQELFGFSTREERALFDKLRAISGIGPRLALAILSYGTPVQLASIVLNQDVARMSQVPGIGKKKASMLIVALQDVFKKDKELQGLVALQGQSGALDLDGEKSGSATLSVGLEQEATEALLAMGFTTQEIELALKGYQDKGIQTVEKLIPYALRRLGGGK